MSSGSTQSKQSSWLELLSDTYGNRVQDVFEGTQMHDRAQKLGFGLWLVPGAVRAEQIQTWNAQIHECFNHISDTSGSRSIALKGKKTRWYDTIQCVAGSCTCKYDYEGTARHRLSPVTTTSLNGFTRRCGCRTRSSSTRLCVTDT